MSVRCHRCDAVDPDERHKCPHGRRCTATLGAISCLDCRRFKARQSQLFDADVNPPPVNPLLKWAGGKRQLLPQLMTHAPPFRRYFEPFVGGGAVFFALAPACATINDSNKRLVRAYQGIAEDVDAVIDRLKGYPFDKEFYLELRSKPIDDCESDVEVACWLIYLNRTGFNGLYRVNKRGDFNVPWGSYKNPTICDEERLRACAAILRRAEILHGDFMYACDRAARGDLVYFDPPYVPVKEGESFTSYTRDGFGLADQVRLRDCALALKARGVSVMITNSNTRTVRELYGDGFKIHRLRARGTVAANAASRGERVDLLIV